MNILRAIKWFLNIQTFLLAFLFLLFSHKVYSEETITLQLRWHNQFQFAGYYAAIQQGYYQEAGLNVVIVEGQPNKKPVLEVLNGNADYGVGNSEVLLSRLQGSPLVALAAVYQHSPSVLIVKKSSGIRSPHDLVGRKVMMMNQNIDADFIAMFHNEGIDLDSIKIKPSSYEIEDLINGGTAAFNSYITNEPFYLKQRGVDYSILNPRSYGVDFYSDILFTTESEIEKHPKRVEAFRQASLKGWQYAFEHPQEIIDLLLTQYNVEKKREHLEFEAEEIKKLVLPNVVEIGHMNPWRWEHMAKTFTDAGMVKSTTNLTGFDYQHLNDLQQQRWSDIGKFTSVASIIAAIVLLIVGFAYRKTKHEVKLRVAAESALKKLAYTDSLTGLNNRHQLYLLAEQAMKTAARENTTLAVCYIDIDKFKDVNDKYGHHLGDELLKKMAKILLKNTRKSDIVARIGGDEFILIFANITIEHAKYLLNNIHHELSKPMTFDEINVSISISAGISMYPENGDSIDDLLKHSDGNMYHHKATS